MNDNYMKTILSGVKEWTENLTDDAKDKANNALDKALFVVNITSSDGRTFSADKTFEEIVQAYNEGKYSIVAHIMGVYIMPPLGIISDHAVIFGTTLIEGGHDVVSVIIAIAPDNSIQMIPTPLATENSMLPNPYPLTFTGAVNETYDGSSAKTIEIPIGLDKALYVVNLTADFDTMTLSADKTFEEIKQVHDEGKYSIVLSLMGMATIPLYGASSDGCIFVGVSTVHRDIAEAQVHTVIITKDNVINSFDDDLALKTDKLPNPYPLTFTGAVSETYDGSSAKTIEIPIGLDGITPTIGDNGNWYLGATDTGKPSRGEKGDKGDTGATGATGTTGANGQSAYAAAQAGGYTDTEANFYADLAAMQGLASALAAI